MNCGPKVPARKLAAPAKLAPKRNGKSSGFDRELGAKLRAARLSAGINQTALGIAIGVSFQQIQQYELGQVRIAAGALQAFGEVLGIHPGDFFDEVAAPIARVADLREAIRMAAAVQRISNLSTRERLTALIEGFGQDMDDHVSEGRIRTSRDQ